MDWGIAVRFPEVWQVIVSKTGQENIQPPIQWVVGLITMAWSGQVVKLTTHPTPPGLRIEIHLNSPVRLYVVHMENSTYTFTLNATEWYEMDLNSSIQGPVAGSCEHGIWSWVPIEGRQFLGRMSYRPESFKSFICSWVPEFINRKKGVVTKTSHILLHLQSPHIRSYNVCGP